MGVFSLEVLSGSDVFELQQLVEFGIEVSQPNSEGMPENDLNAHANENCGIQAH